MQPNSPLLDQELFTKFQALPTLPFYKAVRIDDHFLNDYKERFFQTGQLPEFTYTKANKLGIKKYLTTLEQFEAFLIEAQVDDLVRQLYQQKTEEMRTRAQLILAIQEKNDAAVTDYSKELFGAPVQDAQELEREFLEMLDHAGSFHQHSKPINGPLFIKMVQATLEHYGMTAWRVRPTVNQKISIGHGFYSKNPIIRIPKKLKISKARAARLLTHEIEVHALRTYNGSKSTLALLERGLDNYISTDEGLATYFQSQVSKNVHQHSPGFWDAWASVLTQDHSFAETFEIIRAARTKLASVKNEADPETSGRDAAWRLCLRSYRGISDLAKPGVGFLRDHIYRSGNILVTQAIEKFDGDLIDTLFKGNLGLKHVETIDQMNLPIAPTPELISKKIVRRVLKENRKK